MASSNKNAEREPLLRSTHAVDGASSDPDEERPVKWLGFTTINRKYRWVPFLGCAIIFINEAEYFVKQVATMRAIEAMYCYEYYLDRDSPLVDLGKRIPEKFCKHDIIQKQLATTAGLIMFVRMLSAMIGAIPLGWVADRYGRKVVLILHKVNVCIACTGWVLLYLGFPKVPIWTLYLSGTPGLIGGNFDVGLAMLFASYTDVMPSATERVSLFFITTSMQYVAQTFCPSIGAFLMNLDGNSGTPQVNLFVSLGLAIVTAVIAIFIFPETVHESKNLKADEASSAERGNASDESPAATNGQRKGNSLLNKRMQGIAETFSGVGIFNTSLLCLSICFAATGIKSIDWYGLIQYPVIKLHWTFPQASSIVSLEGVLMLIYFSVGLPAISRIAAARLGPNAANFSIMAISSLLLTIGSLGIGLSATTGTFVTAVVVYLFGEGLPPATQGYIVSLVDKSKVARVMATLSMASIFGKLAASLFFPKLLGWGLDSHIDILVGLPFFVSAGMFVISAFCVGIVGYRTRKELDKNSQD